MKRILPVLLLVVAGAACVFWWHAKRVADRLLDEARRGDPSGLGAAPEAAELGLPDPFPRFVREMKAADSFEGLCRTLSGATRLTAAGTRPVVKAFLQEIAAGEKGLLAHFDEIAASYQVAVDESPRFSVLALAGGFFEAARRLEAGTPNEGRAQRRFRDILRTFPLKETDNIRRFLLLARTIPDMDMTVDALRMRGAERPTLFCSIGSRYKPHDARQALLMEKDLAYALAHPADCDEQLRHHLVGRALDSLLSAGLWARAAAAYRNLPEPRRGEALAADAIPDVRVGLASALLLSGDRTGSRALVERYLKPKTEEARGRDEFGDQLQDNAARAILLIDAGSKEDPFEALLPALWDRKAPAQSFRLVEARVARERYPDIARPLLVKVAAAFDPQDVFQLTAQQRALYDFLGIDLKAADAEIRGTRDAVHAEIDSLPRATIPEAPSQDPMAATMRRLIGMPRLYVWKQSPLPAGERLESIEVRAPAGFSILRAERIGQEVTAVGMSRRSELEVGTFWLLQSKDSGKSWLAPIYLSLTELGPYVPQAESPLPIIAGGIVQLAVKRARTSEADGPPVLISCLLAELQQDSDGDGLTDLLEEALLLDPRNPDTDGDGIPDGVDPMPNVPARGEPNPLSVVTTHIAFQGAAEEDATLRSAGETERSDGPLFPTGYVVADRTAMGGPIDSSRRVVVLTRTEAEMAARKLGFVHADEIDGFQTSADRSQAYFTWIDPARSLNGATIVHRRGDVWKSHTYASWSTQRAGP